MLMRKANRGDASQNVYGLEQSCAALAIGGLSGDTRVRHMLTAFEGLERLRSCRHSPTTLGSATRESRSKGENNKVVGKKGPTCS